MKASRRSATGARGNEKVVTLRSKRRQQTALHEAGHAVIQLHLGGGVTMATIIPSGEYSGCVRRRAEPDLVDDNYEDSRIRQRVDRNIMASLAGQAAEEEHVGRRLRCTSPADYEDALNQLWWLFGSENEEMAMAYLRFLEHRTRYLVQMKWWAIAAVAAELLKRGKLTGKEIKQVVSDACHAEVERRKAEAAVLKPPIARRGSRPTGDCS